MKTKIHKPQSVFYTISHCVRHARILFTSPHSILHLSCHRYPLQPPPAPRLCPSDARRLLQGT